MRHSLAVALLVASLAVPGLAVSGAPLPFHLTFSGGTIVGTFGGVPVTGTYTGTSSSGTWVLNIDSQVFASGTYSCNASECTFDGTRLLGRTVAFVFTAPSLVGTDTGSVSGLFATHGAWVSAVARWANSNLSGVRIGQVVSAAARIQGPQASSGHDTHDHSQNRGRGR